MLNNPNRGYLEERSFYIAEHDLRVKQRTEGWLANTGNLVWDGAIIFSKYLHLAMGAAALKEKRVIELGAGTGLVGIVAAILGTGKSMQRALTSQNVERNDPQREYAIEVAELAWGNVESLAKMNERGPWDLILASEVVYDDTFFEPLLATWKALASKHTTIMLAYTHRHPKEERFWVECKKWFECTEVRLEDHLPDDYIVANFHIFRITLKT